MVDKKGEQIMNTRDICNRIRGKRNEKRITQEEMASRLGITQKTYNLKENCKTEFSLTEIATILNVLECNFTDIFLK